MCYFCLYILTHLIPDDDNVLGYQNVRIEQNKNSGDKEEVEKINCRVVFCYVHKSCARFEKFLFLST